ncbi:hypothetical protein ColKHC_11941 [Colletotrichum higginsianum]|nr:hypothetical protein ColKHC_11941 [Colletotrichum higginsianum]
MSVSYIKSLVFGGSSPDISAETSASRSSECRLVPEPDTSDTLTLPDGRKIGYAQFGLATGKPVFYCHGLPGSRVEAGHLHKAAMDVGARIIATDRPGMGLSTFQPGRTLLDHPKDLEQLAEHLRLPEYAVMGRFHLSDEERLELQLQEAEKNKATFPRQENGIWDDREIVGRMVMTSRQYYAQGIDGVSHDGYLDGTEFGFRIEDIRSDLPVRLWYGKDDTFVPANHGRQIARRLGTNAHLRVEDDTHASIFFRWRKEVLADLVSNM